MPHIFYRERGKLTKRETPFSVTITEVKQGERLLAFAQDIQSNMLQNILISASDAKTVQDDPDWKGPRQ